MRLRAAAVGTAVVTASLVTGVAWGGSGGSVASSTADDLTALSGITLVSACPTGKRAVLGGFSFSQTPSNLNILAYRPGTADTVVAARFFDPYPGTFTVNTFCAKHYRGKIRSGSKLVTHAGNISATVRCKAGERLDWGGYEFTGQNPDSVYVGSMRAKSQRAWKVTAHAFESVGPTLHPVASCVKGKAPFSTASSGQKPAAPDSVVDASAKCPHGTEPQFGGYNGTVTAAKGFVILKNFMPHGPRWKVEAQNENPNFSGTLTAYAYCS